MVVTNKQLVLCFMITAPNKNGGCDKKYLLYQDLELRYLDVTETKVSLNNTYLFFV